MNPDEAWIITEGAGLSVEGNDLGSLGLGGLGDGAVVGGVKHQQRRLVTLADIRREYQDELDRMAVLETGQFPIVEDRFGGGGYDEMDVL